MKNPLFLIIVTFALSSCAGLQEWGENIKRNTFDPCGVLKDKRAEYVAENPDISSEYKKAILEGRLLKGMDGRFVRISWGSHCMGYRASVNGITRTCNSPFIGFRQVRADTRDRILKDYPNPFYKCRQ